MTQYDTHIIRKFINTEHTSNDEHENTIAFHECRTQTKYIYIICSTFNQWMHETVNKKWNKKSIETRVWRTEVIVRYAAMLVDVDNELESIGECSDRILLTPQWQLYT